MGKLTSHEAAILRMALDDEARRLGKDAINTSALVGAEYPRMLYRKTEEEERDVISIDEKTKREELNIRNLYDGFLCETVIVDSADDAETLAADGWDISPAAAYGVQSGLVAATTAKDDEIASLRSELAALNTGEPSEPRRGPGRPPRQAE